MYRSILICFIVITLSVANPAKEKENPAGSPDIKVTTGSPSITTPNNTLDKKTEPPQTQGNPTPTIITTAKPDSDPSKVNPNTTNSQTTTTLKPPTPDTVTGQNTTHDESAPAPTVKPGATTNKFWPTEAPIDKATENPYKTIYKRGFDGGSFIGGIILTLGLIACGFVGFKYYKNHTERNYRTL